nr:hypothetical protein GCM10020093_028120 [Planobispora longispora]
MGVQDGPAAPRRTGRAHLQAARRGRHHRRRGRQDLTGIGIGSTRRQLRRAYPDLETAGSGFPIAAVPRNPNAHYYFLLSGRKVSQMALVLKGQDCMN